MGNKGFLETAKGKIITAVVGVAAVAGIVTAVLLMNGNTYRSIIAKDVSGTVNVTGEYNNGQAYPGERLYGGDEVSVMDESSLTMLMDNDKYLFAEANTHFLLRADQSDSSSRIRIILDKGSELNELRSSLGAGDSYDVDTPNSTMSVRGTKFNVTVYTEGDTVYTLLEVSEGVVLAQLRTLDGTYTGTERKFFAGESVLIRGGRDFSEFVSDDAGETVRRLDLSSLPPNGTDRLIALLRRETGSAAPPAGNEGGDVIDTTAEAPIDGEPAESNTDAAQGGAGGWWGAGEGTTAMVGDPYLGITRRTEKTSAGTAALSGAPAAGTAGTTSPVPDAGAVTAEFTSDGSAETTSPPLASADRTSAASGTTASGTAAVPETSAASGTAATTTAKTAENGTALTAADHTHRFGAWQVTLAATCTERGTQQRVCEICGYVEVNSMAATGHKYGTWTVTKAVTCETDGTETRTCTVCGSKQENTVAATGHSYGEWTVSKAAACETDGTETRTCSKCGNTEERTLKATGHSYGEWTVSKAAACETDGTETRTCTKCGNTEERTIKATGHKYGAWTVTKAPGCETTGTETQTCSVCGKTADRTIDATGHNYVRGEYNANMGGYIWTCSNCGDTYIEPAADPNQTAAGSDSGNSNDPTRNTSRPADADVSEMTPKHYRRNGER